MDDVKKIALIGAGLMGHSIAQTFGQAGKDVFLYDLSEQALQQAMGRIEHNLRELADWGVLLPDEIRPTINRLHVTTVIEEAVSDADVVVEAVFEDVELKRRVFRQLDTICPQRTILASNASSFRPSEYAGVTNRQDRVLGTHYFYPPHLIPLVEIVRGEFTSDATVQTIYDLLKASGRLPVIAQKEAPGFIGNRLQSALFREALYIVEQGIASPQDVDTVVKTGFGRRLPFAGLFEMMEIQGDYEMMSGAFNYIFPDLCSTKEVSPVLMDKVKRGELGSKTGRGFYEWPPGSADARREALRQALLKFLQGK